MIRTWPYSYISPFPVWLNKPVTPELDVLRLNSDEAISNLGLWFHPSQKRGIWVDGRSIYSYLLPSRSHRVLPRDAVLKCLSRLDLWFLMENPDKIPSEWRKKGLWVYAWRSVAQSKEQRFYVPCLYCDLERPYVEWFCIDGGGWWRPKEPAGTIGIIK